LFPSADSPLERQTSPSAIFKSVSGGKKEKKPAAGKMKEYLFDLELGLQLPMHTADRQHFL